MFDKTQHIQQSANKIKDLVREREFGVLIEAVNKYETSTASGKEKLLCVVAKQWIDETFTKTHVTAEAWLQKALTQTIPAPIRVAHQTQFTPGLQKVFGELLINTPHHVKKPNALSPRTHNERPSNETLLYCSFSYHWYFFKCLFPYY